MTISPPPDDDAVAASNGAARRIARWLFDRAERPGGVLVLVVLALLEATIFPAPTEAMLLALGVARPRRAWWLGGVAAIASVAGGLLGYRLGLAFFESFARPMLASRGLLGQFDTLSRLYRENALVALVTSGYTPIPYLLYTMTAGATRMSLATFVIGSLIGRTLKYAPLSILSYFLGPSAREYIERYAGWIAAAVVVGLLGFFLIWRR